MYKKYLVTGATGFLGNTIVNSLRSVGADVRALVVPDDPYVKYLPEGTEICNGFVDDRETLKDFFDGDLSEACLIHSAAMITIATKENSMVRKVNVEGTKNILNLAKEKNIKKVVYVSSVHAIEEKPKGHIIEETKDFDPNKVIGQYAKSKAEATNYALKMANEGLPVSICHPSGIIGPKDYRNGSITNVIITYLKGKLPCSVNHGYDFVDVRDVAEGVIQCTEKGRNGECYILSNRYITIDDMLNTARELTNGKKTRMKTPLWLLRMVAPICERRCVKSGRQLYLTPYSVYTMRSNASFTYHKANKEWGYEPRPLKDTMRDTIKWLKEEKRI